MLFPSFRLIVVSALALTFTLLKAAPTTPYEWEPGAVFREHSYFAPPDPDAPLGPWPQQFEEIDPGKSPAAAARARQRRILRLNTAGAVRAEMLIETTPVHISTSGWFTVNWKESRRWIPLPLPANTPDDPAQYHYTILGSVAQPLPLDWLKDGDNEFRFTAGPQLHHLFNTGDPNVWGLGCLWIYNFSVRVFHPRTAAHPQVRITGLAPGDSLGENPSITYEAVPGSAPITRVDIFACYDGYNVSGSGFAREWHGQLRYGEPALHVGSASAASGRIVWDTSWIPDQEKAVRLVARAIDADGWHSVSPIVEDIHFARRDRHVRLVPASDVPPRFSVVYGQEKSCHFEVGELPTRPTRARLQIAHSFGGPKLESVKFNGVEIARGIGRLHRYNVDWVEVPLELVRPGQNTFSIYSTETVHGPEMDWPGPALLLEFARH